MIIIIVTHESDVAPLIYHKLTLQILWNLLCLQLQQHCCTVLTHFLKGKWKLGYVNVSETAAVAFGCNYKKEYNLSW